MKTRTHRSKQIRTACATLIQFGNSVKTPPLREKYNVLMSAIEGMGSRAISLWMASVVALLASILALPIPCAARPASVELSVAAAADLSSALKQLAANYEQRTGVHLKLSFGSSGMLTQELQNGASFDVFLSADMDYPRQLVAAGLAEGDTLTQYARGKLALWTPSDSHLDLQHDGMNVLLDPSVKKVAIANPQHAPYGRAALAALKHSGLYDRIKDRLVMGENVAQAAQFVESGNAQAGFVALAHARALEMSGKGKYWIIPADDYPPLDQGAIILTHSQHKQQAADFLKYLGSAGASELLQKYGFTH
jgi:molybdate transport system substrate-binding protein